MFQDYITAGNFVTIVLFTLSFLSFNFSIFKYLDSRFKSVEKGIVRITVAIARMGNGLKHVEEELQ